MFLKLLSFGIKPIAVLDGQMVPMKGKTHRERSIAHSRILTEQLKLSVIKVDFLSILFYFSY